MLSEATLVDATATVAVSSKALHRPNMFIYNQYKYITAVDLLVFFSLLITALVIGYCIHCLIAVASLAESLVFLLSLELVVLN
jgi:hypothetical protein